MIAQSYGAAESGQSLVEYSLILVLIVVVAATILAVMGDALGNTYTGVISQLPFH